MRARTLRKHWQPLSLLTLVAFAHVWLYSANAIDDSFIFYRYGRSLALGQGLTFNAGQYVEGFSSPLWTLLCGLLHLFPISDPHPWMQALGSWCALVAVWLVFFVGRKLFDDQGWAMLPAFLLVCTPAWACYATSGMETSLHICLLSAALLSFLHTGIDLRLGLIMGVAALCRPETPYLFGVLCVFGWLFQQLDPESTPKWSWSKATASVALFVSLWGGWLLFRSLYYGALLPNTYWAKALPFASGFRLGLEYVIRYLQATYGLSLLALLVLLVLRRWHLLGLGLLWLFFCLPVLRLGGDWMPMFRFFYHYAPFEVVLWSSALWALCGALKLEERIERQSWLVGGLIASGCLLLLSSSFQQAPHLNENGTAIRKRYKLIGRFLSKQPGVRKVAMLDVGAIAYYAGAKIKVIDLAGLTDVTIAKAPGMLHQKRFDPMYVFSQKPEWIILHTHGPAMRIKGKKGGTMAIKAPDGQTLRLKLNGQPFLPPHKMFQAERRIYLHSTFQSSYQHTKSLIIRQSGRRVQYAQHLFFRRPTRSKPRLRR